MFNNRLIKLRKDAKLTQEGMAKKIGIHRGTYANYERGHRQPDYETLQRIADTFDVTVDYLLGRTDVARESDAPYLTGAELEKFYEFLKKHPDEDEFFKAYLEADEKKKNMLKKFWKEIVYPMDNE